VSIILRQFGCVIYNYNELGEKADRTKEQSYVCLSFFFVLSCAA